MAATADRFSRLAALKPTRPLPERPAIRTPDEADSLGRLLGAGVARNHFGEHLSIRNWFSTPEFTDPSSITLELLSRNRDESLSRKTRAALEDPEKWLFLDTETTGLAGGTGTYAFLVGIAWWDAGGLQVEQLLMRDFSEEHSLLVELAARIAARPVLVTFNGKSFDWPLLESRYLMTRSIRVPELAAHLDLLHPARAVWKLRLGSVRLVELERQVLDAPRLGWNRENDVPSSLIPQFYFDYLRGGSPAPLAGVVRHNRMDLRGLAALFGKLNSLLSVEQSGDTEALDLFGLSRYLQRRGDTARAESACVAARERGLPLPFDAQAKRELAQMAKRRGEYARAAEIWEELLGDSDCKALACEELAMHHHRRDRDFNKALEYARLGLEELQSMKFTKSYASPGTAELRRAERLTKRVARLEERLAVMREPKTAPLLQGRRSAMAGK